MLMWFIFFSAMAFITYILLAGMALGIQKRSALLPRLLFPAVLYVFEINSSVCVCVWEGSLQRFLDCVRALPSCGLLSRSWWCCWVCTCWRYTATSPPLTSLPTVDTNMLGKCQFLWFLVQTEALIIAILYIKIFDTSLPGWSSPCYVVYCLAVMVILWG